MPEISIIVPVYKVENYLRRCIDSILDQTFTDYELILIDDGSPDHCPSICEEYAVLDRRVHVIHQTNCGVSAARNVGIEWSLAHSDSQWITFIDSDDWVHPQYLEALYKAAETDKTRISMCAYSETKEWKTAANLEQIDSMVLIPDDAYTYKSKRVSAYPWGRLYHKSLLRDIRFPVGKLWEDLYTTYRILFSVSAVSVIPEPLYFYYVNEQSIVRSSWTPKKMDQLDGYLLQIPFFQKRNSVEIVKRLAQAYINCIHANYVSLRESNLSDSEKKRHSISLRKRMRYALFRYSRMLNLTMPESLWAYEVAYPCFMNAYWFLRGVQKKLIK